VIGLFIVAAVLVSVQGRKNNAATSTGPTGRSGQPATSSRSAAVSGEFSLPAGVLAEVEHVPVKALVAAAEAKSSGAQAPKPLPSRTAPLAEDGKPEVLYVGAEFCPFCAAERWAVVMALSKFGKFTRLMGTSSSAQDTDPSTPTFSFYRSAYLSPYLSFVGVEGATNEVDPSTGYYDLLQSPTAQEERLLTKWTDGGIPFVYLAGRYYVGRAQYDASRVADWQITKAAAYLTSGDNRTSRGAEAAAGYLLADICSLTHDRPASACSVVPADLQGS
jgi:hypothetical protein